ncbi:MAG: methylthioribulose 1-phosphate dehydratase [Alicyclobacillus sp.]|nr:methylthioribulose 1-phosphate dehydratase [Alicyclobacillus sp.]
MIEQAATDPYAAEVVRLADRLAARGWLPATSGNLSVKVESDPLVFAITRSGADKQRLQPQDVIRVNAQMQVLDRDPGQPEYKPSAETIVHVKLYEQFQCGCVLHVHTLHNNLASQRYFDGGNILLQDHELLKALDHWEPRAAIRVPIVENYHDIPTLAAAVADAARADVPGVLVRNHGIYVWGATAEAAQRYLEAFEFLFEYDSWTTVMKD